MKKRILCLVMAVFMAAGTSITAFAEKIQGNTDWVVSFDGKKMNSNFTSSDMNAEVYKLLPGDSMELQIGIRNTSQGETDWYMTNEIIQSLEDSQSAADGGAYTYRLTYLDHKQKETVLFSSEKIGGEGTEDGLEQATEAMEDYFYLDRLGTGQAGSVHLTVSLDGETQSNGYQDTLAKLQMDFAVEKVEKDVEYKTGETVEVTKVKKVFRSAPKTGDASPILLLSALALVSGLVLLFLGIRAIRRRRSDEEGEE